jgi:hypothetical protein
MSPVSATSPAERGTSHLVSPWLIQLIFEIHPRPSTPPALSMIYILAEKLMIDKGKNCRSSPNDRNSGDSVAKPTAHNTC